MVPGTGIEPAHPCERQILSLLRLPIPPPGQEEKINKIIKIFGRQYYAFQFNRQKKTMINYKVDFETKKKPS